MTRRILIVPDKFKGSLSALEAAGAILVDITEGPNRGAIGGAEFAVLLTELKVDLNLYLASTDPAQAVSVTSRPLR